MARVGLVFGGRSTEHQVSVVSARAVATALEDAGHTCVPLGIDRRGAWASGEVSAGVLLGDGKEVPRCDEKTAGSVRQSVAVLLQADIDLVFPLVHGTFGEDGTLQGLCEMLDLAYVGCGVTASALAMDKALTKRVLVTHGIPVVPWIEVRRRDQVEATIAAGLEHQPRLQAPFFVKPSVGGSSVGVRRVGAPEGLADAVEFSLQFDELVLIEQGIIGREIECSVLGNDLIDASVLGEIVPGNDFYDYADKYLDDNAGLIVPAALDEELAERMREFAVAAMKAIGGTGMARVDFLLSDDREIYLNELNSLPGFTAISMYPKLWQASGVPIEELVDRLIHLGLERRQFRVAMDHSIREWLATLSADGGH